jgi:hypothetical protein
VRARRAAIGRLIAEGVLKPDKDEPRFYRPVRPAPKARNGPIQVTDLQLTLQFGARPRMSGLTDISRDVEPPFPHRKGRGSDCFPGGMQ